MPQTSGLSTAHFPFITAKNAPLLDVKSTRSSPQVPQPRDALLGQPQRAQRRREGGRQRLRGRARGGRAGLRGRSPGSRVAAIAEGRRSPASLVLAAGEDGERREGGAGHRPPSAATPRPAAPWAPEGARGSPGATMRARAAALGRPMEGSGLGASGLGPGPGPGLAAGGGRGGGRGLGSCWRRGGEAEGTGLG